MCGILVQAGDPALRAAAEGTGRSTQGWDRAMSRLARRGPDGAGEWTDAAGLIRMGHTRLAIVDLTDSGRQPMAGRIMTLAFNGEIYNAPELRHRLEADGAAFRSRSDTEALLIACERWGFQTALDRLRGMFAFVLWDGERRELFAAVDPAGQKPLVWSARGGGLWIASDTDALREVLPARPRLCGVGLCDVLCLGYCPAPRTVWEGVSKLGPGCAMRFRPGVDERPRVWRWWSPPEEADHPALEADEFHGLWREVVGDHLMSDVPLGLFLSGGIDSSAVAAAVASGFRPMPRTDGQPLTEPSSSRAMPRAFTVGIEGPDDESTAAAQTAAHLGMESVRIPLRSSDLDGLLAAAAGSCDEPQGFGALLTATAVCRAARAHGKVMLTGDGGDETFAGYAWHRAPPAIPAGIVRRDGLARDHAIAAAHAALPHADGAARSRALASLAALSFTHAHLQSVMPRFHPAEAAALFADASFQYDEGVYAGWAQEHDRPALPWPRRAQRLDLMTFCAGSILPKTDRASMAVGLELRAPFLDRRVLERALGSAAGPTEPGEARPTVRHWLRNRVPAGVLTRRKQGFSLRLPDSSAWVERLAGVRDSRLVRDGVLRPDFERFVGPDAPNRAGRAFALAFLAAWYEQRAGAGE